MRLNRNWMIDLAGSRAREVGRTMATRPVGMALILCLALLPRPGVAQMVWDRLPGNTLLEPGPAGSADAVQVMDPSVVYEGQTYHLWYTAEGDGGRDIGYARSDDGLQWEKYPGNPVLEDGVGSAWDGEFASQPAVLYRAGQYRMWYAGYDGARLRIGYASSADGAAWTKQGSASVLDVGMAGAWDGEGVSSPAVVHDGSSYHLWYAGYDGAVLRIGHATSSDGIAWTRDAANPVLDTGGTGSWDGDGVSAPAVTWDGRIFRMWYAGSDGTRTQIGYATSLDGIAWTRQGGGAVVGVGAADSWDAAGVGGPAVIREGATYRLYYTGHDGARARIGYASSRVPGDTDGDGTISSMDAALVLQYVVRIIDDFPAEELSVSKEVPMLPLYRVGLSETSGRSGERVQVHLSLEDATGLLAGGLKIAYDPSVLQAVEALPRSLLNGSFWQVNTELPGEVRCAFAAALPLEGGGELFSLAFEVLAGSSVRETSLTIAEASFNGSPAVQMSDGAVRVLPAALRLMANYPNPFNAETMIQYEMPEDGTVSLRVYGTGGQLVRRLVSGQRRAGTHQVTWDGRDEAGRQVASGAYVSWLIAGDGARAGKLLLLR